MRVTDLKIGMNVKKLQIKLAKLTVIVFIMVFVLVINNIDKILDYVV